MTAINRYVLGEVLKAFFLALCILTLVMLVQGGYREASHQGLEPRHFLRIVPFLLPDALRIVIPAAILFAVSLAFGRMAANNEIVALKSLGVNPVRVLVPTFVFASILSLAAIGVNEAAVSWGRNNVQLVVIESIEEILYSRLRAQQSFSAPNFSIIVRGVEGRKLIQPTITFQTDAQTVTLRAAEAELRSDPVAKLLVIACTNGTLDIPGQARMRFYDTIEREIPLDDANPSGDFSNIPSHMPLGDIPSRVAEVEEEIAELENARAGKFALRLITGNFGELVGGGAHVTDGQLANFEYELHRLRTELPRRWSSGFSCLCFVLVGAPMAIWRRNGDILTSFFACFGPILVLYYPLLMLGVKLAKNGSLPPMSVWLGNIILAALGYWLLRRIIRY